MNHGDFKTSWFLPHNEKPYRNSSEALGGPSESVLRRRAGWFFQTSDAVALRIDGSDSFYDVTIVPVFLQKVLNVEITAAEWHDILCSLLGRGRNSLNLDLDLDHDMDTFWPSVPFYFFGR